MLMPRTRIPASEIIIRIRGTYTPAGRDYAGKHRKDQPNDR